MPWKLAMKRLRISSPEEIEPGGRFRSQVRAPSLSHGKPVRHDLFVSVGCLNAQLVELQELRGVGSTVVAGRQVWLELAGSRDAA